MRVFIIGFMGCGKTTLGKKLAKELGLSIIDLDHYIEAKLFMSVPEIFEKYGEAHFRQLEHESLLEVSKIENVIVSTGGGAPCFYDNMDIMNNSGITLFMNLPTTTLADRLLHARVVRPLAKGKNFEQLVDFISEKMNQRMPFYEKAKIIVNPLDMDLDKYVELVKQKE